MAIGETQQNDYLWKFLRHAPVFHALLRAMECRYMSNAPFEPPLLDLGCGDGLFAAILLGERTGAISCGIDKSFDDILSARKTGVYRLLQVADLTNLPLADNSFGAAFSNSVFEHLVDIDGALREAFRVLRPGGKLILTAPNDRLADHFIAARVLRALRINHAARAMGNLANRVLGNRLCLSTEQWREKVLGAGFRSMKCTYLISPKTFNINELFVPFAFVSLLCKRTTGHLRLAERKYTITVLHAFLKKYYESAGDSDGVTSLVVAEK